MSEKAAIRKEILKKRDTLTVDILRWAHETAANRLVRMSEYARANTVMAYMDYRKEVPTGKIVEEIRRTGRALVLPRVNSDFSLTPYVIPKEGNFYDYIALSPIGIPEPRPEVCLEANLQSIDLVIIPGSVFDQFGNRIGYGKGCYDRFLPNLSPKAFKLALAYDFQVLQCIPADPHDVRMDKILTIVTRSGL